MFTVTATGSVQRQVFTFSPPTVASKRGRQLARDSWWMSSNLGVTLWFKDGVWQSKMSPDYWETDGATHLFRGGYTYTLTDQERADLIAGGYGSFIASHWEG